MNSTITRRAALAGAFASSAALAVPAAGVVFAPQAARASNLPDGHGLLKLGGRQLLVDFSARPHLWIEHAPTDTGRTLEILHSEPQAGVEYLAERGGELLVGPLVAGDSCSPLRADRQCLGFVAAPEDEWGHHVTWGVHVLGEIIG